MYKFSQKSQQKISTCHPDIQEILDEAINLVDFSVLCGHRGEEEQNNHFQQGRSKLKYPQSKHNKFPSRAVDIAPYPIDWKDLDRFSHLAGIIKGIAHMKGIKVTWGGDWDNDGELKDNKFNDLPHFQIEDK